MSVYVMAWAWEQDCTPTEKFVLLALADHAKDDGTCWPGMRRLAEKTGYTRRTVINAIKSLGEKGLLSSAPRHNAGIQTTNLYLLQAPDVKSLRNGVKYIPPRGESLSSGGESLSSGGESLSSGGESDDTLGVKEVHTEPLKNQTSIKQPSLKQTGEAKKLHGDFVRLTPQEHQKLIEKLGEAETADLVERLNNYIGSKGKKYKSHYHTILTWEKKEKGNGRDNDGGPRPGGEKKERNFTIPTDPKYWGESIIPDY